MPSPSVTHVPSEEMWQKSLPAITAHMYPAGVGGAGAEYGGGGDCGNGAAGGVGHALHVAMHASTCPYVDE